MALKNQHRSPATIISKKNRETSKSPKKKTDLMQTGLGNRKVKLTLKELHAKRPPGYKKFQAAVGWRNLDEETALNLWEDIFKPLSSFEMLGIDCE